MSGIRLKRHPQHRALKAYLDTLPPAARARWWRGNRRWVDKGKPGPPPEPPRRPWTAEKVAEHAAAVRKYRAESDVTRQDEIEWHARLLNLRAVEGGGKKVRPPKRRTWGRSGDGERDGGRPPLKLMPTPASDEAAQAWIPKPGFQPEPPPPHAPAGGANASDEAAAPGADVDVVRALLFVAERLSRPDRLSDAVLLAMEDRRRDKARLQRHLARWPKGEVRPPKRRTWE